MDKAKQEWKYLSKPFNSEIGEALILQHQAAQLIAIAGKYLIPEAEDDSHTNMEYDPLNHRLVGNSLPDGFRVALGLKELSIQILNQKGTLGNSFRLAGKTKNQAFDELKRALANSGVDVSELKNVIHYQIPQHKLDEGSSFEIGNEQDLFENALYRHNAKIILNEIASGFEYGQAIRVWPHHFDTGAFFTISKNERGDAKQTIGIGFAIPDSMVKEPYFYLSFWSEEPLKTQANSWSIDAGKWLLPEWNGAVLKLSEILKMDTASRQFNLVKSFYNSGIKTILDAMK